MKRSVPIVLIVFTFFFGCSGIQMDGISEHMDLITATVGAASKAARPVAAEEEYYIGRSVAARILSTYPLYEGKQLTEYVNKVGQTVALHSDVPLTFGGYHFAVLDSIETNAFASPGGTIFVTRGMIKAVKNEDELAAVLAHEVAHINHRDGIASIKSARWAEAAAVIGSTAAKEYGSQDLSKLVTLFEGSIDDVFKTLVVNGYGQSRELLADKTALIILARSGYSPEALKDFVARMIQEDRSSSGGILQTHPATTTRLDSIKANMSSVKTNISDMTMRTKRFFSAVK